LTAFATVERAQISLSLICNCDRLLPGSHRKEQITATRHEDALTRARDWNDPPGQRDSNHAEYGLVLLGVRWITLDSF